MRLLLTLLSILTAVSTLCPSNATSGSGGRKCLLPVLFSMSNLEAQNLCKTFGGRLARIEKAEDNQDLEELTQGFNERQFWINVKVGEGRKNCSDSNCTFANWGPERPCVSMESGNGRWALRNCSNRFPFLCEFDPIQIPPRDELPEYQNTQFAQCRPCPSGWAQHGLHCYGFFDEIKNWNNAEEFCENLGGHLASIHFQTEIDFVEEVFKDVLSSSWPPFVGATTQRNETKWTDGTTFTFDKWAPHLGPRNGHCVNIQQHKLASVLCNTFANFICKKSVVELRN